MNRYRLLGAIALLFILQAATPALATECVAIGVIDDLASFDISAGAVTTVALDVSGLDDLVLEIDLTDADNGVTDLEFTITEARTATDTFRKYPDCVSASPVLTCAPLRIKWNPQANGKNFEIFLPALWKFIKITVTPTGHGAGDSFLLNGRGCR